MTQFYSLTDANGETRLLVQISPTPGGVFNGGTITAALAVAPATTVATAIEVDLPVGAQADNMSALVIKNEAGQTIVEVNPYADTQFSHTDQFSITDTDNRTRVQANAGGSTFLSPGLNRSVILQDDNVIGSIVEVTHDSKLGFYAQTPAAKPTGVAVSAAGIHAALVTLGLISA